MESIKVTGLDGIEYQLQPIRAGQMRDMAKRRLAAQKKEEVASFMDDNLFTILYCLQNAEMKITMLEVEKLDYPTYKKLLSAAQEISGFTEEKKPGENLAALTGVESIAA